MKMKKLLCSFLALAMMFTMTTVSFANPEESTVVTASSSAYADAISTNGDSHGTLSVDGDTVTLKATGTIGWKKNAVGQFGNWIGFKVTAPTGIDAANVTILRSGNTTRNLAAIKDGTDANGNVYAHMYVNVANGEGTYVYKFDWTSDGVYDLNLVIDATEATLAPNPDAHTDAISTNRDSHGTLSANGNTVTLKATGTIGWLKNAVGKFGNWIGFKVTAPAGIDAANVTILRSDNATRNLAAIKDGKDANGNVYSNMYVNVAGGEGTYIYKFDWTSDGVYDLTLVIDATDATLTPDPAAAYTDAISTNGDSHGTLSAEGDTVTLKATGTIGWKKNAVGQFGNWVGFKVTAPTGIDAANVTILRSGNTTRNLAAIKDGTDANGNVYAHMYVNVAGGEGTYIYKFDWTSDGVYDLNLVIDVTDATIAPNPDAHTDAISTNIDSHGTLSANGNTVTLKATGTIGWKKNPVGKFGNWIGFKVTAPAGIDAANVTILRSDNATRNLAAIKDGTDANGNVYANMYVNVANGEGTYTYKIDWTSDGVYDLTVVIDATDATLTPDPASVFGSLVFISNMDTVTEDDAIYYPLMAVTAINSLNYSEVGFTFKAVRSGDEPAEITKTEKTSQVYSKLNVTQTDGTTKEYDEEDMGQKYLFGKTLWFNTEDWANDNTTLYITPFAIGKDGKTIYGSETKITNETLNAKGTQLFKEVAVNE